MLAVVIRELEDESRYVGVSGAAFNVIEDDNRLPSGIVLTEGLWDLFPGLEALPRLWILSLVPLKKYI